MLWGFVILMVGGLIALGMSKRRLKVTKADLTPKADEASSDEP